MITDEEKELLRKLGVPEHLFNPKKMRAQKEKDPTREPKTVDLTPFSGVLHIKCLCCGSSKDEYVDYVKRADDVGYCMKKMLIPTNPISREHHQCVYSCKECSGAKLLKKSKADMVQMIENLRIEVRRKVTLK